MSIEDHIYQPDQYSIACVRCGYIQDLGDKPDKVDLEAQGWTESVEADEDDEQYEDIHDDTEEDDDENDENEDDEYGAICPSCNGVEASSNSDSDSDSDSDEAIENNESDCQLLVDTLDNLYAITLKLHLQQVVLGHNLANCDICQSLAGTNTLLISYGKGHS